MIWGQCLDNEIDGKLRLETLSDLPELTQIVPESLQSKSTP